MITGENLATDTTACNAQVDEFPLSGKSQRCISLLPCLFLSHYNPPLNPILLNECFALEHPQRRTQRVPFFGPPTEPPCTVAEIEPFSDLSRFFH